MKFSYPFAIKINIVLLGLDKTKRSLTKTADLVTQELGMDCLVTKYCMGVLTIIIFATN
jgi:hypothetical protein